MKIDDKHFLVEARRAPIPGGSAMPVRRFLVMHFTAGWSASSTFEHWKTSGTSAHIVIERDGTVYQCRPFNRTCGHAGPSKWKDPKTGKTYNGLNSCSIGIELCNAGILKRDTYPVHGMGPLARQKIPTITARHKNGGPIAQWERFSAEQIIAATRLAAALVARYRLDDVVGHDDIAPARKNDPGPAFPMTLFRDALGFPPLP
jgi:N-acetylmuramoyl-L-alanine amidase